MIIIDKSKEHSANNTVKIGRDQTILQYYSTHWQLCVKCRGKGLVELISLRWFILPIFRYKTPL